MIRQPEDETATPKHRLWRKIGRFFLFLFLAAAVLTVAVAAGLYLYFTPARIEKTVKPIIAQAVGGRLDFSLARFNLFNGFVLKNLSLTIPSDDQGAAIPLRRLTAREASLRYSLKRLLRRQLVVEEVLIDSPVAELSIFIQPTESQEVAVSMDSLAALPVDFRLRRFRLINAELTVDARDSLSTNRLFLSEINLFIDDLRLPRGDLLKNDGLLAGDIRLQLKNSRFLFSQRAENKMLENDSTLDAELYLRLSSLNSIRLDGRMELAEAAVTLDDQLLLDTKKLGIPLSIFADSRLDVHRQHLSLDSLILAVQHVPWFKLSAEADSLFSQPIIHGRILKGSVKVSQLLALAPLFAGPVPISDIYLHDPTAELVIENASFGGRLPTDPGIGALSWSGELSLKRLGITVDNGLFFLRNLNAQASARGALLFDKMSDVQLTLNVDYDSLAVSMPDQPLLYSGALRFQANAALGEQIFPAKVRADMTVSDLMGGDLKAALDLDIPQELQRLKGFCAVAVGGIDLASLSDRRATGFAEAAFDLHINNADSLTARVSLRSDSIAAVSNGLLMIIPPMSAILSASASADLQQQRLDVKKITLALDDVLSASASAALAWKTQSAAFQLHDLTLDHSALYERIPQVFKTELVGARITGRTRLTADAELRLQPDTSFTAEAKLQMLPTAIRLPLQNVQVNGLQLICDGRLDSRLGGLMNFVFSIDSTTLAVPQPITFRRNAAGFRLSLPDFETALLDTGYVSLPDLKTLGTIKGRVERMTSRPELSLKVELHQAAEEPLAFGEDLLFQGHNDVVLTINAGLERAAIELAAAVKDLSLYLPNDVRVSRVNADLSFQQEIDLNKMTLLGFSPAVVRTPSDGLIDYMLFRNYYAANPNKSRLTIRKVQVGNYVVENITADAYLGSGRIEIPYFAVDLYGGNIGGQFYLSAGERDPLDISYRLSAHFSDINSSLLLPAASAAERSNITAHAELYGRGIDIAKGIDLDGYFNITQIESKVADNLLRALDPEGKDSGIRSTRLLINRGFKPRLFRFEIRHGFCYPAVYFKQPWYFPVRLSGGGIELSRIPIVTLLKMNQTFVRSGK